MSNVLVVEDEDRMRKLIVAYLKKEGYYIFEACDGAEAIEVFNENNNIDIVILDVMMPLIDGWGVLKFIRRKSNIPVIMLTAKEEDDDKLQGLNFGADKYLTKPISPKVLVAEVNSMAKRAYEKEKDAISNNSKIIKHGVVYIDLDSHTVKIDGEKVYFSLTEYNLLIYLIKNKGILLTREQILRAVWGINFDGDERVVDTNIKRIRKKLEENNYITTIRGIGYKFEEKAP